jgi:hypothetical protein
MQLEKCHVRPAVGLLCGIDPFAFMHTELSHVVQSKAFYAGFGVLLIPAA